MRNKGYSVKDCGDGKTIKRRYQEFREVVDETLDRIEEHDPRMAASARLLLSTSKKPKNE